MEITEYHSQLQLGLLDGPFFDRMKKGQIMLASDNVKFSVIHIDDFSKMVVSLFGNEKVF